MRIPAPIWFVCLETERDWERIAQVSVCEEPSALEMSNCT